MAFGIPAFCEFNPRKDLMVSAMRVHSENLVDILNKPTVTLMEKVLSRSWPSPKPWSIKNGWQETPNFKLFLA